MDHPLDRPSLRIADRTAFVERQERGRLVRRQAFSGQESRDGKYTRRDVADEAGAFPDSTTSRRLQLGALT